MSEISRFLCDCYDNNIISSCFLSEVKESKREREMSEGR